MAAPHVAGAAALALAANPARDGVRSSSRRCCPRSTPSPRSPGKSVTGGRLNADAAVAAINGPLPTPTPDRRHVDADAPEPTPVADADARPAGRPARRPTPAPPAPVATPVPPVPRRLAPLRRQRRRLAAHQASKLRVRFRSHSRPRCASHRQRGASGRCRAWTRGAHAAPTASRSRAGCRPGRRSSRAPTRSPSGSARPRRARGRSESDSAPQRLRQRQRRQVVAAAPANARGSSLSARSRSSWRSAGVSRCARAGQLRHPLRSSGVSAFRCRRASSASWTIATSLKNGIRLSMPGSGYPAEARRADHWDAPCPHLSPCSRRRPSCSTPRGAILAASPPTAKMFQRRSRRVASSATSSPCPARLWAAVEGVEPGTLVAAGAARGPARRRRAVRARRQRARARRTACCACCASSTASAGHARRGLRPDAARDGAVQHRRRVRARERGAVRAARPRRRRADRHARPGAHASRRPPERRRRRLAHPATAS